CTYHPVWFNCRVDVQYFMSLTLIMAPCGESVRPPMLKLPLRRYVVFHTPFSYVPSSTRRHCAFVNSDPIGGLKSSAASNPAIRNSSGPSWATNTRPEGITGPAGAAAGGAFLVGGWNLT